MLLWHKEWGAHIEALQATQEQGIEVKALDTMPQLLPFLDVFFLAYRDLQYDRPVGFSTGSIPWSSVIRWCHIYGIYDTVEIERYLGHIRAMEKADFEFESRKKEANP